MVTLPEMALIWIIVLGFWHAQTSLLLVMGAATALSLGNVLSINLRIRRAGAQEHNEAADPN
jgi:hypothetical protein